MAANLNTDKLNFKTGQKPRHKIDWSDLFLSASGRTRAVPFVVAIVLLMILASIYDSAFNGALQVLTGWIVYPALFYTSTCVLSKRLHDRGRSGWWAAILLVALVMVWPQPVGFFDFVSVVILLWATIDLGVMPGERGTNLYGPSQVINT
jgi:uncharacterized membrane protein YhaH (DUF805 family)